MFSWPVGSTTCTIAPRWARARASRPPAAGPARPRPPPRRRASASSVSATPGAANASARLRAAARRSGSCRRADEARDEEVRGRAVDLCGVPNCCSTPVLHDRDAVRHRHRLELVVRDIDHRPAERGGAARSARPACGRAAWRRGSTAARPAGRRVGSRTSARPSATRCCCPPESWRGLRASSASAAAVSATVATRASRSAFGHAALLQRIGDVLRHRHVRIERVGLEHHRDVALRRAPRRSPRGRRCGSRRWSETPAPPACAASSSCRSPTGRAGETNSPCVDRQVKPVRRR